MADVAQIADLLSRGLAGPQGAEDSAFHTGIVQSWDSVTGVNVINVNGTDVSNVKALQAGIPNWFVAGDTVVVMRKQTQYFVVGKVSAPGGRAGSGLQGASSNFGVSFDSGGVFADVTGFANTPQVTVYIGSTRRALVLWQCEVFVQSGDPALGTETYNNAVMGEVGWAVSGASTIAAGSFSSTTVRNHSQFWNPQALQGVDSLVTVSGSYVIGPGTGLNIGSNTFTMKYKTFSGRKARFGNPSLVVVPF